MLKDKVVVITGGGRGLGRSLCLAFAKEGAKVATCSRNQTELDDLKTQAQTLGLDVIINKVNVADLKEVIQWSGFIKDKYGTVDVLINNAAVLGDRAKLAFYPAGKWREVMEININGVFYVTQNLLPLVQGCIINVTSSVGRTGRAYWGAYAVSKFAVEGFTQVLAEELKESSVVVVAVNPGATRTRMRASAYPEEDPMTLPHPDDLAWAFIRIVEKADMNFSGKSLDAHDILNKLSF